MCLCTDFCFFLNPGIGYSLLSAAEYEAFSLLTRGLHARVGLGIALKSRSHVELIVSVPVEDPWESLEFLLALQFLVLYVYFST